MTTESAYEVEALRGLLIGVPTMLWLDTLVLVGATVAGITAAQPPAQPPGQPVETI